MAPSPNTPQYVPTEEVSTTGRSITRPWITRLPGHLERQTINPAVLPGAGILGGYAGADDLRPLSPSPVTRYKAAGQVIAGSAPPPTVQQYGLKYINLRAPRWAEGAYGVGVGGVTGQATEHAVRALHAAGSIPPNHRAAIAAVAAASSRRGIPTVTGGR